MSVKYAFYPTVYSFIHFRTEASIYSFQFALRWRFVLQAERTAVFFLERFSPRRMFFCWFFEALFSFFFTILFFSLQITSRSPFRTSSYEQLDFFAVGVLCLPTDFLLFHALVPGLLQGLCFVLRRGFLCIPIDFLLIHTVVPGLLRLAFVQRTDCHCCHILLVPMICFFVFTFFSCAISFHSSARIFLSYRLCYRPSPNNRVRSPTSAFCLANVFHCISMSRSGFAYGDAVLVKIYGEMSWAATSVPFSVVQSWNVILCGSRSPQLQWNCRETAKHKTTSGKHNGGASDKYFLQRNLAKIFSR